jgi:hypothetical protein
VTADDYSAQQDQGRCRLGRDDAFGGVKLPTGAATADGVTAHAIFHIEINRLHVLRRFE